MRSLINSISITIDDLEKYSSNVQKSLNETDGHLPSKVCWIKKQVSVILSINQH